MDIVGRDKNIYQENSKKNSALKMEISLNRFEQYIKDISDSADDKILEKLKIAHDEFYQLRYVFLPNCKAVLDNPNDIDFAFRELNRVYSSYAFEVKQYRYLIENNPYVNKEPTTYFELEYDPYFVKRMNLESSLKGGKLFSDVNEKIGILRNKIQSNL